MSYKYEFELRLNKTSSIKWLNDSILTGRKKGYDDFIINIGLTPTYSNVCAPVAGILDYYRAKGCSFEIRYDGEGSTSYPEHTRFENPLVTEDELEGSRLKNPFDKVWTFSTPEAVSALTSAYILSLRQQDLIDEGVIKSLDWCITETLDNVLQHSGVGYGYAMAQFINSTKQFSFCVFDTGMGIYNSLRPSRKFSPSSPYDAITLALQERVTRDESIGQGNGLWGLSRLIAAGEGSLSIHSCGAAYSRNADEITETHRGDFNLGKNIGTTLIDFQLYYSKSIDVTKALNGYEGLIDYWIENLDSTDGEIFFPVAEYSSGTGTRQAAAKFRNMVLNVAMSENKKIILDFSGVNLISSSYADELIGKIISKYGFMYFVSRFGIVNMSAFNAVVVNRSVGQRLAQTFYDSQIEDIKDD